MSLALAEKQALVCGGSDGLGYGAAEQLAKNGCTVIIMGRSVDKLKGKVQSLKAINNLDHRYVAVDFLDLDQLETEVHKIIETQAIHILINNCGGPSPGRLQDADIKDLEMAFRLHVLASHLISNLLIPKMISTGYGRIINIISTSVRQPIMGLGVSNTIRGAMASWSKTLSLELAETGITVNNILPGTTNTARLVTRIESMTTKFNISKQEAKEKILSQIPMKRFAEVEEIGKAIGFLASPDAAYITGVNLQVDGGKIKSI